MTPDRFSRMIEAYGADPGRWPQPERADGRAYVLAQASAAEAALAAERALDGVLDAYAPPPPSAMLQAAILAGLPGRSDWKRWAGALGAGLAAACAAGVVSGVQLSKAVTRDARTEAVITAALTGAASGESVSDEESGL